MSGSEVVLQVLLRGLHGLIDGDRLGVCRVRRAISHHATEALLALAAHHPTETLSTHHAAEALLALTAHHATKAPTAHHAAEGATWPLGKRSRCKHGHEQ
jgi:hypothetical protein